jgi:imidazoleglycerol phosphate synthase glutamine amidotransferase subunit HisH
MKKWQSTIINHHSNAVVLSDTQVKIPNIGYSKLENESYDDIITRQDNSYFIESFIHDTNNRTESYAVEYIRDYLGY